MAVLMQVSYQLASKRAYRSPKSGLERGTNSRQGKRGVYSCGTSVPATASARQLCNVAHLKKTQATLNVRSVCTSVRQEWRKRRPRLRWCDDAIKSSLSMLLFCQCPNRCSPQAPNSLRMCSTSLRRGFRRVAKSKKPLQTLTRCTRVVRFSSLSAFAPGSHTCSTSVRRQSYTRRKRMPGNHLFCLH